MWRENFQNTAALGDAVEFGDKANHIRHVLDHVAANDLLELVVGKRIREDREIVNDVGVTARVCVDADSAGKLVLAAADVQNSFGGFGHAVSFSATASC